MRKHTSMKKIREVLRLTYDLGLNQRQISESVGISRSAVQKIQARCKIAKLRWPLNDDDTDEKLSKILFPKTHERNPEKKVMPNWNEIHKELKVKGITRQLLWIEYKETHSDG